ncbi:hypothetical protein BDD12DRAFT_185961 [Trichophaea hybrida]|nr:hypothetical protein BDD12DRAFT_185961 [Trichophaea hybrida]
MAVAKIPAKLTALVVSIQIFAISSFFLKDNNHFGTKFRSAGLIAQTQQEQYFHGIKPPQALVFDEIVTSNQRRAVHGPVSTEPSPTRYPRSLSKSVRRECPWFQGFRGMVWSMVRSKVYRYLLFESVE